MRQTTMLALSGILLCGLAAAEPVVQPSEKELFDKTMQRGREALQAGRVAEAETLFRQVCQMESLAAASRSKAGSCLHHLATAAAKGTHPETAPPLFQQAADAWKAAGPAYADTWGFTMLILGDVYQQQRQPKKAAEALLIYAEYLRSQGKTVTEPYAQTLGRLAVAYGDTGRMEEARKTIEETIVVLGKLPKAQPLEMALAHNTLGVLNLGMGFQKEAEASLRLAEKIGLEELGEMSAETAGFQTNLALALLSRGDVEGAEVLLRRAKYVVGRTIGAAGNEAAMIEAELSAVSVTRNKLGTAANEAKTALEIFSHQQFPDARGVALAQVSLADVYLQANRLPEAEQLLAEAIPAERRTTPESRLLADGLRRLAKLRALQGRYGESRQIYQEAIALYEVRLGKQHPAIVPLLRELAETLKRDGAPKAEIRTVESRAKSISSPGIAGFAPRQ